MGSFITQVFELITQSPGNLAYHLVLTFAIAGALQSAFNQWRDTGFPQGRRMLVGLVLLLAARVALFIAVPLASQDIGNLNLYLPVFDRTVTILGLILIIWLWVFPEPLRLADAASGLLVLLTFTAMALTLLWRASQAINLTFNATWFDIGWEIMAIMLIALGTGMLLLRRPNGWGFGFGMLAILFLGHLFQLLAPVANGNLPAAVRLTQMAAYPLLFALPQRFAIPTPQTTPALDDQPTPREHRRYGIDPEVIYDTLTLGWPETSDRTYAIITRTIAETMLADLCLLVFPPNREGQMFVQYGYDLIQEKSIEDITLEEKQVPLLTAALRRASPLRLPASSTSRDLVNLANNLGVSRTGHVLAVPITDPDGIPIIALLLLSPYSNRGWSREDQTQLLNLTNALAQILQRKDQLAELEGELTLAREEALTTKALLTETQDENTGLRAEISNLSERAIKTETQAEDIETLLTAQRDAIEVISRLQAENKRLEKLVEELIPEEDIAETTLQNQKEELRLALEEIARLRMRLSEADEQLIEPQEGEEPRISLSDEQIDLFASIAQDLRQPMASIVGYTDLLLGESVGILGALQRKFLERIKASTERMEGLLDDLFHITALDSGKLELVSEAVDLGDVIDEAIGDTSAQMREKSILLRVDLPDQLPQLQADRDSIQQILIHLLRNASLATPVEGKISLHANLFTGEDSQDFVLIQVTDQGGGIPSDELPKVFSRLYRADNALIEGVGDTGVGLSIAKTLVEAHSGRIWVDSIMGEGSTFSVLIPLLEELSPNSEPRG